MATQSNLDYQTFWAPRPLSRLRCAGGQSHSRPPMSQLQSLPLLLNDDRCMIAMPKESLDPSHIHASGRDDFINISDDVASDMSDVCDKPFNATLPSDQAIVQFLEEAGTTRSTVHDCDQVPHDKDKHEPTCLSASSAPPEDSQTSNYGGPSVELVAECTTGASALPSRIPTSTPTSIYARSRTSSPLCESPLWNAASPQTRCTSMSAEDKGTRKTFTSEKLGRFDNQLHSHSSAPQPPSMPLTRDYNCGRVSMLSKESLSTSPRLTPSKDDFIYISDDAESDMGDASCDELSDETLPSVQALVRSLEETGTIGNTVDDREQSLNSKDEPEAPYQSTASTPPDHKQVNHNTGLSSTEPLNCPTGVASSISRIRAPTPSTSASSRTNSPPPESQPWDTVSTHTSCTFLSTADEGTDKTDNQKCTETTLPEKSDYESSAPEHACDKNSPVKPLVSHMHLRPQNKRPREPLVSYDTERPEADVSTRISDDPEYCPLTSDELDDDSDSQYGDKEQPSRKRRKFQTVPRRTKSPSQESAPCESARLDKASELVSSATPEDTHGVAQSIDAAFDEWVLQNVVLKRTIMDGKATFLFQFDWDMCMNHGEATGRVCKGSDLQGRGRSIMKSNQRKGRKPRDEAKGRRCGVCGQSGHNARTCQTDMETSNKESNN